MAKYFSIPEATTSLISNLCDIYSIQEHGTKVQQNLNPDWSGNGVVYTGLGNEKGQNILYVITILVYIEVQQYCWKLNQIFLILYSFVDVEIGLFKLWFP